MQMLTSHTLLLLYFPFGSNRLCILPVYHSSFSLLLKATILPSLHLEKTAANNVSYAIGLLLFVVFLFHINIFISLKICNSKSQRILSEPLCPIGVVTFCQRFLFLFFNELRKMINISSGESINPKWLVIIHKYIYFVLW